VVLVLALTEVLEPVAEFGRIFAAKRPQAPKSISFQEKTTLDSTGGQRVTLILQKKQDDMAAPLKIELADSTGKLIGTLYQDEQTEEESKEKRPLPNVILHTKIGTAAPFKLLITAGEKKEEATVGTFQTGPLLVNGKAGSLLQRGIIELN
jgi:hypothetical protein